MKKQKDGYVVKVMLLTITSNHRYSSVEMMRYSIEELDSYKVIMDEKIIGEL